MRTKEEFRRYVYAKAEEKRSVFKKQKALFLRGVAAFSVLFIVGGVWIYRNRDISIENAVAEASPAAFSIEKRGAVEDVVVAEETESPSEGTVLTYGLYDQNYNDVGKGASSTLKQENAPIDVSLSSDEALKIAKEKCTIEYNSTNVSYDYEKQVWEVEFFTAGVAGGCQTVYVDNNGTASSIFYGE